MLFNLLAQSTQPQGAIGFIDALARTKLSHILIFVLACTAIRLVLFPFLKNTPVHKRLQGYKVGKFFNEALDSLVYAGVLVFMVVRPFALQTFYIPSGSMLETLQIGDYIVANKFIFRTGDPKAGDIVVFKPPKHALYPGQPEGTDFIKRLIGAPGQMIEIKDGELYRDGKLVPEPYRKEKPALDFKLVRYKGEIIPINIQGEFVNYGHTVAEKYRIEDFTIMRQLKALPPEPVPAGMYLMMGDNRNGSFDGRGWGLVPRSAIIGRAEFIWWPVSRWQATR